MSTTCRIGTLVVLFGLHSKPEWNGKLAVICGFDETSKRYIIVQRDASQRAKVKGMNLVPFDIHKRNIQQHLKSMGFPSNYIQRAFKVYEKHYGHGYNVEVLVEIIVRLQNKDKCKRTITAMHRKGVRYFVSKEYEKSLDALHRLLEMVKPTPIGSFPRSTDKIIANTTLVFARNYFELDRLDAALEYCQQSTIIGRQIRAGDASLEKSMRIYMTVSDRMHRTCVLCRKKCYQCCSKCQIHWYCSKKHQKIHWKSHHRLHCDATVRFINQFM